MFKPCFPLTLSIFQRIEGLQISKSLSMFGQSISGQIDADNNGYVGGYKIYHVFFLFFFFFFLGLYLWHMEVPRLGVESEP